MMKVIIRILILISLLFAVAALPGCRKKEVSEFTDTPVIQSYLEPGDYLNVNISRQIPFSSNPTYSPDDINNLPVQMICNNTVYTLKPAGGGRYVDSSTRVTAGGNYTLSFSFNSKKVQAYTYIPGKPTGVTQSTTEIFIQKRDSTTHFTPGSLPDPVQIAWNNPDQSYYLLLVENTETNPVPINGSSTAPPRVFRKSPSNSSTEQIRAFEFQYFGMTRIILYHVLPDYASLYTQSSASSQNLTNPSTSITNGYGIFTGLNSDTLWINVMQK